MLEADRHLVRVARRGLLEGASIAQLDALGQRLRAAVARQFGIAAGLLAFVRPGSFPRTSSGKVQRARCKALALEGALDVVYASREMMMRPQDASRPGRRRGDPPAPEASRERASALVAWLRQYAQRRLDSRLMDERRARVTPGLAAGRQLAAFALTEPAAGANPLAMRTRALRVAGGWRLSGEKHLIGLAGWAGWITVLARAVAEDGAALGTVALLVPEDAPGLRQEAEALTMGMRAMVQNALRFEDVFVPDAQVLGRPGNGMEVARDAMAFARLGIGALCVGAMKRCAQLMLRYAARCDVAGGRLADNPVTLARLDELSCAIVALESLVQAVGALDGGGELPQEACMACKCVASELLWQAADHLMQLLGGRGYPEPSLAPQLLRGTGLDTAHAAGEAHRHDPFLARDWAAATAAPAPAAEPAPALATRELVRECVLNGLRDAGVHEIGDDTSFAEAGMDSLAAMPVALELEQRTGLAVNAELLYEFPSVAQLAAYIDARRDARRQARLADAGEGADAVE